MKLTNLLAGAVLALCVVAGTANASTLFTNSAGLSGSYSTVTFDELSLPKNTVITNQYAPFGVNLNGGFINADQRGLYLPPNYITNFCCEDVINPDLEITFNHPVSEAAFELATGEGFSSFKAFLGSTLVGSGDLYSYNYPAFYGFTGGAFNKIVIVAPLDNSDKPVMVIKNVEFAGGVPEPASWALMLCGFAGLGAAARARRPRPGRA